MKKLALFFITTLALVFTACSSTEKVQEENSVKTIKVGTSGTYYPFTFFKDDVLQGFEIDVWKAIGERLGYNIEFTTAKFSGLFGMLETKKIDTISNQITMTDNRMEKYYFAQPYVYDGAQIIVNKETNDITSLEDLKGKKVGVGLGTNYADMIRAYDKNNNNEIEIITYEGNGFEQDVVLNRISAYIQDRLSAIQVIKQSGLPLKIVGDPIKTLTNSFPFLKTEENKVLVEEVNGAIQSLKEDGTLTQISMKWFDTDITKK